MAASTCCVRKRGSAPLQRIHSSFTIPAPVGIASMPSPAAAPPRLQLFTIVSAIITTVIIAHLDNVSCQLASSDGTNLQQQQQLSSGIPISVSQSGEYRLPSRRVQEAFQNPLLMSERQNLMYPHTSDDLTEISSGRSMHDQALSFRLPFFGFSFEYIWVQRDGYLSFNKGMQTYKFPLKLPLQPLDTFIQEDPSIMAPFFAMQDIATEVPLSGVYFRVVNLLIDNGGYNHRSSGNLNNNNNNNNGGYYLPPDTQDYELLRDRILLDFREGMIGASDFVPKYAIIVTWRNMTIVNRRRERPLKTNTYQAVIATDEIRTYAMFNYEQIQWITHLDNYDGLKGSPAFVGFNAGNTTRTFEFNPFSQTQRVSLLPSSGLGNRLRGRYFFQLDEEVWPGACINKKLEPNLRDRLPLTFFPRYGHMLGGTLVDVTGPCLQPDSIIFCRFDNFKSEAVYRDNNHATCISPPFMYHGYVDLTISVDGGIEFVGRYYVQPPDIAEEDVIVLDGRDYLEDPRDLELKWKAQKLSWSNDTTVTISLWGYRETMNLYPALTYIDVLVPGVRLGQSQFQLRLEQFFNRDNYDQLDMMFGFIAINLTNPQILGSRMRKSPIIWSRPMPLAWYFKPQWQRQFGYYYKDLFCDNWHQRESQADRFAPTIWRCPCTSQQARIDRGRFSPDPQCNIIDRRCDVFHRDAVHCINTGRPSIGGSGQTCCYDDQEELIQTADTMFGGRPSRAFRYGKHPFKTRMMTPTLSTWVHDVVPFFYCCKWQDSKDNSESCQKFNQFRTSQDCSLYQAPAVGSVYGDPHMVTFNKHNYTFNGKGEYVLVHTDDPKVKFNVHARFEQVPRRYRGGAQVPATQLTAVAAMDNSSSVVEFRVRPLAARWRYQIYVLVDDQYIFWWDKSMQLQNFRGVTLYQPAGIQNMSHIIAMFDSGAGVEVMSINGYMSVHVYLPLDFQGSTGGLLGNYSRRFSSSEDLVAPNGARFNTRTSPDSLHNNFGQAWRLTETEKRGVGRTLLSHSSVRFALYDQPNFMPELRIPPELPMEMAHQQMEMEGTCGDSISCIYDFIVTLGDSWMASATRSAENLAMELAEVASMDVVRCPALPKPANGMKSENRYNPGRVVRFTCDTGYRLVGYEARYCRPDGLWSWGEDPVCIAQWRYYGIMFLSVLAALLPFILTLAAGLFCLMFMVKRSREHRTGETGEEIRTFREKPPSDLSGGGNSSSISGSGVGDRDRNRDRNNRTAATITNRNGATLVKQFEDDDEESDDDDDGNSSEEDEEDYIDDIDDDDDDNRAVLYKPNRIVSTAGANNQQQQQQLRNATTTTATTKSADGNQSSQASRFMANNQSSLLQSPSQSGSPRNYLPSSAQQQLAQQTNNSSNNIMRREFRTTTTSPQLSRRQVSESGLPQRNASSSKSSNVSSREVQI